MKNYFTGIVACALLTLSAAALLPAQSIPFTGLPLAPVSPVRECAALRAEEITAAVGSPVALSRAAVAKDAQGQAYCRVNAVVDDYGKIEVHLPVIGWTQRFLAGGGPGGSVQAAGFATMSSQDIGNRGNEDVFATNYQACINFGYRIMHLQVLGKSVDRELLPAGTPVFVLQRLLGARPRRHDGG